LDLEERLALGHDVDQADLCGGVID
jgi:hypothetical protein